MRPTRRELPAPNLLLEGLAVYDLVLHRLSKADWILCALPLWQRLALRNRMDALVAAPRSLARWLAGLVASLASHVAVGGTALMPCHARNSLCSAFLLTIGLAHGRLDSAVLLRARPASRPSSPPLAPTRLSGRSKGFEMQDACAHSHARTLPFVRSLARAPPRVGCSRGLSVAVCMHLERQSQGRA